MTRVKICGITNLEDALLSAKFGADALGFNFYEKSPRYISPERARTIIEQLPDGILRVGVFVNAGVDRILGIASTASLGAIQLHGEELPAFVDDLRVKTDCEVIKAFRVSSKFDPKEILRFGCDSILLDTFSDGQYGGTGETFDWQTAKLFNCHRLYLAGGLSHENVADAIEAVRPYAVDACSCLESAKGVKDRDKLKRFIVNAKAND